MCEEVHLNLAYRWFCRLGLDGAVPDHSTFSKNRHGRFRDSDLLRRLFEATVRRCMAEGIVGGEGFVVDASMVRADANRQKGVASPAELGPKNVSRAVTEYLAVLDDAAFGAATDVPPKFVSPTDPAARWTAAAGGPACHAYSDNYLIDVEHAVIVDVEATTAVRQAEVGAAQTMLTRTAEAFGLWPERLIADTGYARPAPSLAVVGDRKPDVVAGREAPGRLPAEGGGEGDPPRAPRQRVPGVVGEVYQRRLELPGVGQQRRAPRLGGDAEVDRRPGRVPQHLRQAVQHRRGLDRRDGKLPPPREGDQAAGDGGAPLGGVRSQVEVA